MQKVKGQGHCWRRGGGIILDRLGRVVFLVVDECFVVTYSVSAADSLLSTSASSTLSVPHPHHSHVPLSTSLGSRTSNQSDTDSGRSSLASGDGHSNGSWVGGDGYHGNRSPVVAVAMRNNGAQRTNDVLSVQRLHSTVLGKYTSYTSNTLNSGYI